jgi:hypothetical protein
VVKLHIYTKRDPRIGLVYHLLEQICKTVYTQLFFCGGRMFHLIVLCFLFLTGCGSEEKRRVSEDFEELTGKGLSSWEFVETKEDRAYLSLFKGIYDRLKGYMRSPGKEERIPRVIHFIWLGPDPFPMKSVQNVRSWRAKHPDWKFCFWTDRKRPTPLPDMELRYVQEFPFFKLKECFSQSDNFGEQSDLLRYEVLYREGGVYVDHDVSCFKPFDVLNCSYDFYCGIDMPYRSALPSSIFTTNNLIGVRPGHPILLHCMENLVSHWSELQNLYGGKDRESVLERVLHRTFWHFGLSVKERNNIEGNRDIVFPAYYFDAPSDELALFARHQYAGTWHKDATDFEINVKKRLMTISKKNNLILLVVGGVGVLNLFGLLALFLYFRSHHANKTAQK